MKFKLWIELQDLLGKIHTAVDTELADQIINFVSTANYVPNKFPFSKNKFSTKELEKSSWQEVASKYLDSVSLLKLKYRLSMFSSLDKKEHEKMMFEYPERNYFAMIHRISSVYGWGLDYINNLDHNDVLALLQEIEVDAQFEKEWEWDLSEKSHSYNPTTKQSVYNAYPRPTWMQREIVPPKKIRVKKSTLPSGVIQNLGDFDDNLA